MKDMIRLVAMVVVAGAALAAAVRVRVSVA